MYQYRMRWRIKCPGFNVEMAAGYLHMHHQTHNGMVRGGQGRAPPPEEAHHYWVYFPNILDVIRCQLEGCRGLSMI